MEGTKTGKCAKKSSGFGAWRPEFKSYLCSFNSIVSCGIFSLSLSFHLYKNGVKNSTQPDEMRMYTKVFKHYIYLKKKTNNNYRKLYRNFSGDGFIAK